MYNQVHIRSHNNHRSSYGAVWAVVEHARTQQIGFESLLAAGGEDKCAIHKPVCEDDTGGGCGLVPIGNHPSIKSLYDKHAYIMCHVEEGARVIDVELARKVAFLEDGFVQDALACLPRFQKRYERGAPVDWVRYGRGYCYLQLMRSGVRHRIARILGPFPLMSDALRFALLFGDLGDTGFSVESIGGDLFHVESCEWTPDTSLRSVLRQAGKYDASARIGGNVVSINRPLIGLSDVFTSAGYTADLIPAVDVRDFLAAVPRERMDAVIQWVKTHGLVGSTDLIANILVASTAMTALQVLGSDDLKKKIRMWQVVGDLVCKQYAAMHVLSTNGSPEEYSLLVGKGRQCNRAMSSAIVTSDFYPVCSAHGLDLQSKAWADILEGVVGVIAMTQPSSVLKHCLVHFGLIPNALGIVRNLVEMPVPVIPQLNSFDWVRAARLLVRENL